VLERHAGKGKTASSRMCLIAWKMLAMALQQRKPGQKYLSSAPADVYPYCHLARNTDAPAGLEKDFDLSINAAPILRVWQTVHACSDISGDPLLDISWIMNLNFMLVVNAISLSPGGTDDILKMGQAIMLPGTMFNHSCAPNASYDAHVNNKIEFKATEVIEAGEEITIPYCFTSAPVEDRQMVLKHMYRFTCDCKKCKAELKGKTV
jgi:hypothetical protein